MEPTTRTNEELSLTHRTWMVEYTVQNDDNSQRHLSLIHAADVSEVHQHLLQELRKNYQTSSRVDVVIHRMEPVSTSTDKTYFEGIFAP
jgi:hypothetical protein